MTEDWHGRLWLSTNRGLARLDPATGSVKNYTPRHGLQDLDFNFGAVLRTRENVMYFGGSNGFNSFYPDAIVDGQQSPSVVLTGVYKLNQPISSDVALTGALDVGLPPIVVALFASALAMAAGGWLGRPDARDMAEQIAALHTGGSASDA